MEDYLEVNKKLWNDKVEVHAASDFYNVDAFIAGKTVLNSIELELLGDITGKSILHLQCHFGQDSIELSRMGAMVTGVDLSDKAIDKAIWLAEKCGTDTKFVCADIYDAPNQLDEQFDIVFTSYGTVGWLPDMDKWASVVNHFMKPDGRFVFADFHPVVWMMDYDFSKIEYSYFNVEAIIEENEGTYTDSEANLKNKEISWNHPMSEVIGALIAQDLKLIDLKEFDYSPYPCFKNLVKIEDKKYQVQGLEGKLPMVYALSFSNTTI
ncbi:class I SAM-dependent methyltransferase [Salibacteraceae bacterium]|nr:class I SAM-dependent methyltransferase [Salibacteraceae bacterium]